ncbi:MAG: Zn-dependent hydrolase [Alphaproteobacteria bacterium]|nr:Zn-dependent hydrolase [Alphaproteobacteria bacterium]
MRNLTVNGERLWRNLMEMGEIGATPDGGSRRLALDAEDGKARDRFVLWARRAGLTVAVDRMGNIFARRKGARDDLPPVLMGSHLDTVPTGGKFDGPLGVLAALEVVHTLNDAGVVTDAPLEVVNWTNEEGSRFSPYTLGSLAFAGKISLDFALSRQDPDGITVARALQDIGYAGEAAVGGRKIGAYFELHIEQGPVLEASGDEIGIVTGSFLARYYVVTVTGFAAHVGPTPMKGRRDALVGAARVIIEVNRIGNAHGVDARSNAPYLEIFPHVRGVIPSEVKVSCDLRHPDRATLIAMERELEAAIENLKGELAMGIAMERYFEFGPIAFTPETASLIRETAKDRGYKQRDVLTIAGHDAVAMLDLCPSGMIFVPSRGGLSHNAAEWSEPAHVAAGANVLLHAVLAKAGVATG